MTPTRPRFSAGTNIAMKVPSHLFDRMVEFYAETLGLPTSREGSSVKVEFGACRLWLDDVRGVTQPELWLELTVDDSAAAARHLEERGVMRCDEVEELPPDLDGFWIAAPGGIIHLVVRPSSGDA